jgi:hypothetical protein
VNNFITESSCKPRSHRAEREHFALSPAGPANISLRNPAVLGPDRGAAAANPRRRLFPRPPSADPHAGEDFHALV